MSRIASRSAAGVGLTALVMSAVLACSAPDSDDTGEPGSTADVGPVSVVDGAGREVSLDGPAERVVCLDGTCIDALAELGLLPVAALEHETAVHPSFFGPDADIAPLGGTFFEPNLEEIITAEPDLVVGSANVHSSLTDALGDIPFYGQSLGEIDAAENLERLGTLTGRSEQAEESVAHWQEVLAAYGPGDRDVSVLSMYGGATQDVGIDAADSAIGSVLAEYTAYPWPSAAEGDSGFLELSLEEVLAVDPAHIWVLDFGFDPEAPPLVESLADNPAWQQLAAVRSDNVHVADPAWWGTANGTRSQMLALDAVLPTLYPDEFPEPLSGLPRS
ncbi:MAG: ABC transporter substrate-binding protein [Actinomycetaceae bacterium]